MTNYIFPLANKLIINAGHLLVSLSFKMLFQCMLLLSHIQLISLLTKMKCSRQRKPEVSVYCRVKPLFSATAFREWSGSISVNLKFDNVCVANSLKRKGIFAAKITFSKLQSWGKEVERMSLIGKYPCDNTSAPTYLSFFTASTSIFITVVASVGNSLVVLAVLLNPNKDLRSPFTYFLVNLSVADLVVGLVLGPLSTVYHIFEGVGMLHQGFKDVSHILYFTSCTASLLSLIALALDRYCAITYPLQYRAKLSSIRALLISVAVWIISALLPMVYFIIGFNKFRFVFANTAIAITFAVLIFTTTKIFKYLRCQVRQWDSLHDSSEENLALKRAVKWEAKITKTLVIMLTLFLAFYLPSCICIYIINFCTSCDCVFIHWVRDIQFVLVMANSGVNPFVYAWRLENFRKAFKNMLDCHACLRRLRSVSRLNLQLSSVSTDVSLNNSAEQDGNLDQRKQAQERI